MATHIGIINRGDLLFQGRLVDLHAQMEGQIVLGVDQPDLAKQVLVREGWSVRGNGGRRLTIAANGRSDAAMVNGQLVRAGVSVYELHIEQPTLEDTFINLTQ